MEIMHPYLTPEEFKAVQMLADDKSYGAIKRECALPGNACPTSQMPIFLASLRKKTGIRDTTDPQQAREYLTKWEQSRRAEPTPEQLQAIKRMIGLGYTQCQSLTTLANCMALSTEAATLLYQAGLHAIGCFATDPREQRVQTRLYFAHRKPIVTPVEPMTPKRWLAVEMHANGASYESIAEAIGYLRPEDAKLFVRKTCVMLGIVAPGRGLQKRLLLAAIAHRNAQAADALNDPMF